VKIEPPLSAADKIAAYTHQFPAGMFNRPYRTEIVSADAQSTADTARVRFSYDAPDVLPHGARFERSISLAPDARTFTVDETASFMDNELFGQRAVSVSSLTVGDATTMRSAFVLTPDPVPFTAHATLTVHGNALGFYDRDSQELATISWRPGDVENARILESEHSIVVRLTLEAAGTARIWYGYESAPSIEEARRMLAGG
jgi:hypothetical protein